MKKNKLLVLKLSMALFFIVNIIAEFKYSGIYPVFVFPHFKNNALGRDKIPYAKVKFENVCDDNFYSIAKPYDHRFVFLFKAIAVEHRYRDKCISFLNELQKSNCKSQEKIKVSVQKKIKHTY